MHTSTRSTHLPFTACVVFCCAIRVASQPVDETLFVGNNVSDNISVYTINKDGTPQPVPGSPFAAGEDVQAIAITADGRKLAATNAGISTEHEQLWLFNVGANGALTPVPNAPFLTGDGPLGLEISSRDFVYSPSAAWDELHAFRIDGDDLVAVSGSPFPSIDFPNEVDSTPDGAYVYTSHLGGRVSGWGVEADGALTPLPGSPFFTSDNGFEILVSPDGRHIYVAGGQADRITGFEIQQDGTLVPLPGSPYFSGGDSAVNLAMNPGGDFLFVCHVVSKTVTSMARAEDGSLAFVVGSSRYIGFSIRKAVASDDFLYVTDDSNVDPGVGVMVYVIEPGGFLTLIKGSPFPAGGRPQDMVLFLPATPFGDSDDDGDVDLIDYAAYLSCVTGPGGGPPATGCGVFDNEPDGDVDLADLAAFMLVFSAP